MFWSLVISAAAINTYNGDSQLIPDKDCIRVASRIFDGKRLSTNAIAAGFADYCTCTGSYDKWCSHGTPERYLCPWANKFVEYMFSADSPYTPREPLSATKFCHLSTYIVKALPVQGARLAAHACSETMGTFVGSTMDKRTAADWVYSHCLNRNCAHALPSRTKECQSRREPEFTIETCSTLRSWSKEAIAHVKEDKVSVDVLCALNQRFGHEAEYAVEAYQHLLGSTKELTIPIPSEKEVARRSPLP